MENSPELINVPLFVTKEHGQLWGTVSVNGNSIVECANSLSDLQIKLRELIFDLLYTSVDEFIVIWPAAVMAEA